MPIRSAETACSRPNTALAEVSDPVMNTPSQPSTGENSGNSCAGAGQRHSHRGRHARRVPDVGEAEHRGDGDERRAQRRRASPRTAAAASRGRIPAIATETSAAIRMAVPVADSQLKLKIAGTGLPVAGLSTAWWITGNGRRQRQLIQQRLHRLDAPGADEHA